MLALFLLSASLVLYGTLYPFSINHAASFSDILPRFIDSVDRTPGRGDVLSNIVLFLPFAFFGMQALLPRAPRIGRLMLICMLGGALSFFIECTQTFIVGRDTSVYDLILNVFGTFIGACAGWIDWNERLATGLKSHRPPSMFPVLLIAAWLGVRLFPYVPTLDFQHVKDAIKPLLSGEVAWVDVLRYFVTSLVIGRLLQSTLPAHRAFLAMPLLAFGVIFAKPFLMTRVMNLSELIGVIAAVVVWISFLANLGMRTGLLALLLLTQIAVQGLIPYELATQSTAFSFIPFKGFEGGSMAINLQAFLEKVFLYGSLIWLLVQTRMKLGIAVALSVVVLTLIELAQTQLADRVSEITDPLLAIIMGLVLFSLERSQKERPNRG